MRARSRSFSLFFSLIQLPKACRNRPKAKKWLCSPKAAFQGCFDSRTRPTAPCGTGRASLLCLLFFLDLCRFPSTTTNQILSTFIYSLSCLDDAFNNTIRSGGELTRPPALFSCRRKLTFHRSFLPPFLCSFTRFSYLKSSHAFRVTTAVLSSNHLRRSKTASRCVRSCRPTLSLRITSPSLLATPSTLSPLPSNSSTVARFMFNNNSSVKARRSTLLSPRRNHPCPFSDLPLRLPLLPPIETPLTLRPLPQRTAPPSRQRSANPSPRQTSSSSISTSTNRVPSPLLPLRTQTTSTTTAIAPSPPLTPPSSTLSPPNNRTNRSAYFNNPSLLHCGSKKKSSLELIPPPPLSPLRHSPIKISTQDRVRECSELRGAPRWSRRRARRWIVEGRVVKSQRDRDMGPVLLR